MEADLLVPHLGGLGSSSPDVGKELQDRNTVADVVQLPQMSTLQDLYNLLGHPLPNPRDTAGLLDVGEAEARKKSDKIRGAKPAGGEADSFSRCLSKSQPGHLTTDGCVKLGHN